MTIRIVSILLFGIMARAHGGPAEQFTLASGRPDPIAITLKNLGQQPGVRSHAHLFPSGFSASTMSATASMPLQHVGAGLAPDPFAETIRRLAPSLQRSVMRRTSSACVDTITRVMSTGRDRHLLAYDDAGRLLAWSFQTNTTGPWRECERIHLTYSPHGQMTSMLHETPEPSAVTECRAISYDDAERKIAERYEMFEGGILTSCWSDSVAFDSTGDAVLYQYVYTDPLNGSGGGRTIITRLNDATILTYEQLTAAGWSEYGRCTYVNDVSAGTYSTLTENWSDSGWSPSTLTIEGQKELDGTNVRHRQLRYVWTAGGWSYTSRTLIVTHDNGRSSDRITETLEGSQWTTSERESWSVNADPNGYSWIHQTWHDGTPTAEHHTEIWGSDGTTTTLDSTWIGGTLTLIEIRQAMLNGQELYMEVQEWMHGAPWSGHRTSRCVSGSGAVTAIESSSWSTGAWVPDTRLIYRYDDDDVLRSVEHQLYTPSHGWVITDDPGLGWASWQFSPCPYVNLTMSNFIYLLFGYGTSLTDVAATRTEVPQQSTLQPNYPNPFNPTTTIPFSVATGAQTTVAIFDVLGREVARPVDQWKDPGEYRVQFDAAGFASGMYVCRFTSGNVTQTRRLMLVR